MNKKEERMKQAFIKDLQNDNDFSTERLIEMYSQSFGYGYNELFKTLADKHSELKEGINMSIVYRSELMEGIDKKAEELAEEYDVSIAVATQGIYTAIFDLLLTDDTELVSQAVGNLKWLQSRLKEDK